MLFPCRNYKKGFTLVELLVTLSIFTILTGVVLVNQTKFNSTILLTNLAYDTALTIRQAQTFGVNIRGFNLNNNNYFVPYGVHLEKGSGSNKSFILFADLNITASNLFSDGLYKAGSPTPDPTIDLNRCQPDKGCVNRYNITRGNYISDICYFVGNSCSTSVNSVDIVFNRPNPDAYIYTNNDIANVRQGVRITLSSADGSRTRKVEVFSNGLIQIKNN
jgi:prepilin-type N-terminal cleavage/methylation domain-containing protein